MYKILKWFIGMLAMILFPSLQASNSDLANPKKEVTILFFGNSGAGKTRMINTIANYIKHKNAVDNWTDIAIVDNIDERTKECKRYTVEGEGSGYCNLTLHMIDTPGITRKNEGESIYNFLKNNNIRVDVFVPVFKCSENISEHYTWKNAVLRLPIRLFGIDYKVDLKAFFLFSYGTEKKPVLVKRLKGYFNGKKFDKINYKHFYSKEQCKQEVENMNKILESMVRIKYGDNSSVSTPLQLKDAYVKDEPSEEPIDDESNISFDYLNDKSTLIKKNGLNKVKSTMDTMMTVYSSRANEEPLVIESEYEDVQNDDDIDVKTDNQDDLETSTQRRVKKQNLQNGDQDIPKETSESGLGFYTKLIGGSILAVGGLGLLYYAFTSKKGDKQVKESKANETLASQVA